MTTCREDSPAAALQYRSRDRRVLRAWKEGQAARAAYISRIGEILTLAQADGITPAYAESGEFSGLAAAPGDTLPPGWRHDGARAVPDPVVAAGRWAAMAIAREQCPADPRCGLPGLPPAVTGPENLPGWRAELLERGAVLYIGWPAGAPGRGAGWPDPRLWEPAAGQPEAWPAAAAGGETQVEQCWTLDDAESAAGGASAGGTGRTPEIPAPARAGA